jgi:SAM-dependent methyltransferase
VIVWPASATTIARIATGDCSDLVSALVAATRAPVMIAPSMNDAMLGSPAVQDNLEKLRAHGRWIVHGTLGVEVAHRPEDRRPMFGPAAPPSAMLDLARHVLDVAPRPRLPDTATAWERLWAVTPLDQLPWNADAVDAVLAAALGTGAGKRLLELGTGTGIVAIEAARRGFRVTATDVAPTALGRARDAAGDLPIVFALDDVTRSHLDGTFDVVVDRGLLHCLPRTAWPAYASAVTARTAPGGSLLVIAHRTGELATTPVADTDLRALLPAFELVSAMPTALSRGPAQLFELTRRSGGP